jgi:hypothetical protein
MRAVSRFMCWFECAIFGSYTGFAEHGACPRERLHERWPGS